MFLPQSEQAQATFSPDFDKLGRFVAARRWRRRRKGRRLIRKCTCESCVACELMLFGRGLKIHTVGQINQCTESRQWVHVGNA